MGTGGNTRFRNPTAVFIFAQSARVQLHLCVNQFAFKPFQHPGKVLKSNSVALDGRRRSGSPVYEGQRLRAARRSASLAVATCSVLMIRA